MSRHPFDPVSFAGGLLLLVLGAFGALGGLSDLDALRVAGPAVLLLLGIVLVGSALVSARTTRDEPPSSTAAGASGPVPDGAHDDGDG